MHRMLQIQELLFNIFGCLSGPTSEEATGSDLPALARTCRAFTGPALDLLWRKLDDPSPLARCLPQAFQYREIYPCGPKCYSFTRLLTEEECNTLRSYARRIRSIADHRCGLDWEFVKIFLNPPANEPLFPYLQHLGAGRSPGVGYLLCMPFPSLVSLRVSFEDDKPHILQASLQSFSKFSPNITTLAIGLTESKPGQVVAIHDVSPSYIIGWKNLQSVDCRFIAFDANALAHLSRVPALTYLMCTLSPTLPDQIAPSHSPLYFSCLHDLTLHSNCLDPVSRFLSWSRLPVIKDFVVNLEGWRASKADLSVFFVNVQASNVAHTIQDLHLDHAFLPGMYSTETPSTLTFEDLQPCMVFSNVRYISLTMAWNIGLTSGDLLRLASAWPRLEELHINDKWNMPGGITPARFLQLLHTCPSLKELTLAIDTQNCTQVGQSLTSFLGLALPSEVNLNVTSSMIEEEHVPVLATFFARLRARTQFSFWFHGGSFMDDDVTFRWDDVAELFESEDIS